MHCIKQAINVKCKTPWGPHHDEENTNPDNGGKTRLPAPHLLKKDLELLMIELTLFKLSLSEDNIRFVFNYPMKKIDAGRPDISPFWATQE